MDHDDVVVIGGGLAGLTAAAFAARSGARVTVLEGKQHVGGRATTERRDGVLLNQGPHALYLAGAGRTVLDELGLDPPGGAPPANLAFGRLEDRVSLLPTSATRLLRTTLLPAAAKPEFARFFAGLAKIDPVPLMRVSVTEWLEQSIRHPSVRDLVATFVRVATYSNAPDLMSAGAAVEQLQAATKGVRYLDGGWQTMVDALRVAGEGAGARVRCGAAVTAMSPTGRGWQLETPQGAFAAAAVVIATGGPALAARLLHDPPGLAGGAPITASALDLGLSRIPAHLLLFGVDRPLYFSVHCPPAKLSSDGLVVASVLRYHAPDEHPDPDAQRSELEEHASLAGVQPDHVVTRRYLHRMVVSHGLPLAVAGGTAGRTPVTVADRPGVFLAGDWVGSVGQLADVSLSSGREAGQAAAVASRAAWTRTPA